MRVQTDERSVFLQEGWVIANHILVSFHVAFISSILALPAAASAKGFVLAFIFFSPETLVSVLLTYVSFHTAIALHEIGHFRAAAKLHALNEAILEDVQRRLRQPFLRRLPYLARVFLLAPYGRAAGIKREGLNYYVDAPYNLAVAAAGPAASRNAALTVLPPAALLLATGLLVDVPAVIYAARLLLGIGVVTLLDFLFADPGKYREFKDRERAARQSSGSVSSTAGWYAMAPAVKRTMVEGRMQDAIHPELGAVTAPWQFRNCGMGGRHTEKEYPESNISMQEAMFLILGARDSQEAQEMTVALQNRLREIIEKEEGCRVMGIGLEGGLAPYVDPGEYPLPEVRLWAMMKQAVEECGYRSGVDVAIALDPALSELEIAYRAEFNLPDSVGVYLFWRDQSKTVLDRDGVLGIYRQAIREHDIPILSIEDGFSEDDDAGWTQLLEELGSRILVIGDDLVTTNDRTIETAAGRGLINAVLVKANQIGTLYETLLAMLVTLGKGLEIVVSHRSKSPNDDMEAHIALAVNALGLKAGGGSNTERLVKYQSVATLMERLEGDEPGAADEPRSATVYRLRACEEPTNAGIPTVGVEAELSLPDAGVRLSFKGATPLGTSAGTGEAVHLVDEFIERAEDREPIERHPQLFRDVEPGVHAFEPKVSSSEIEAAGDIELTALFARAHRYRGKGCLNAVANVHQLISPHFENENVAGYGLIDIDRTLLGLELETARQRGKLAEGLSGEEIIALLQRKQNLGMNAMLAVSLALGRAVAHVRGKQLHELLREEMLRIIERLALAHEVRIEGSKFSDYVAALRTVTRSLEAQGKSLCAELRTVTGVYDVTAESASAEPALVLAADRLPAAVVGRSAEALPRTVTELSADRAIGLTEELTCEVLTEQESDKIAVLNRRLHAAYAVGNGADKSAALQCYLETKASVGKRVRSFGITNHRIFRDRDSLLVPYSVDGALAVYAVGPVDDQLVALRRFPHGSIFTDDVVFAVGGGRGNAIDLEREIYDFDPESSPEISIARLRDMAALLERVNLCGSRHEAIYHLRYIVTRLCSTSFQGFFSAKNLQPEVRKLKEQIARLLNGPFAHRLRLPLRILVRNISGLVSRPSLIDELWADTIDLAEVHVRGSAITNELRRSAHHALGDKTLRLARAYSSYLETGDPEDLPAPARKRLTRADLEACNRDAPRALVERIVVALDKLLGSSEIATRLHEWQDSYADTLMRCESNNRLQEELEVLVSRGIRARNRWTYDHHLRTLLRKAEAGAWASGSGALFKERLEALQARNPTAPDFESAVTEQEVRECVDAFIASIRRDHQEALFRSLREATATYERGAFFAAFSQISELRHELERLLEHGAFTEQRYLVCQLDCLLEEMGYLAQRHLATDYDENGVRFDECLQLIHRCASNLDHDGLFSRELWDLAVMLTDSIRSYEQILDVLEGLQRSYHRLVHRVVTAFEVMGRRMNLDDDELRAMQGNFQRYLHDLNSLAQFADIARIHIHDELVEGRGPTLRKDSSALPNLADAYDIVHLSHTDDILKRVDDRNPSQSLQDRFGGKGSSLIYLSYLGVPTRDAFIIPTTVPRHGLHRTDRPRLHREIVDHLQVLEHDIAGSGGTHWEYGNPERPLLLAVRAGSAFSMPGMLSTVVFVGMTERIVDSLARNAPWYAYDAYRRFLASYANIAWGLNLEEYDLVEGAKRRHGVTLKQDLPPDALREVAEESKTIIRDVGFGSELEEILDDPKRQLITAVEAVFASWDREKARRYRDIKGLSHLWHTAAIVQQMASGNRRNVDARPGMDETEASLTGVIMQTRMSEFGYRFFEGDIKFSACGDDLVGGMTVATHFLPVTTLKDFTPMLDQQLHHIDAKARRFFGTDQEIEFTVDRGRLSVLQARMVQTEPEEETSTFDAPGLPDSRGIGIRGGAFRGLVAFDEADIDVLRERLEDPQEEVDGVLLVLENPTPSEIPMILSADGLLTARGGSTSHAAVAVHGIEDRPYCGVLSATGLSVPSAKHQAILVDGEGGAQHTVCAGDVLSIHGQSGEVFIGSRKVRRPSPAPPRVDASVRL